MRSDGKWNLPVLRAEVQQEVLPVAYYTGLEEEQRRNSCRSVQEEESVYTLVVPSSP